MMRQAGRYLASYQAIRQGRTFWEMATNPEIAAKVSLLPLHEFPVDAIIFFADILSLPYGMGVKIEMKESVGPYLENPLTPSDFAFFQNYDPTFHTGFVGKTLNSIRASLDPEIALIGFAGAPWTVASYLIEGKGSKQYLKILGSLFNSRSQFEMALKHLAKATTQYLQYQCEQGAQIVQLFDTWASEMPAAFFSEFYVDLLNEIFDGMAAKGIPVIYFAKHAHHLHEHFPRLRADVISVDSLRTMTEIDVELGGKFSLQGNLDPVLLKTASAEQVGQRARDLIRELQSLSKPSILNLGHGIFPETPVENVRALVMAGRDL